MPHPKRTNSIAMFGVLVLLSAAVNAQDRAPDSESNAVRVYRCHTPVSELADVLQQVAGDRNVTIVPERVNNVLIVRATEQELARFDALVEQLNRPAPRIGLSLTVLEVDDSLNLRDADPDELLRTLRDDADARIREIRLTSIENQMASVQRGEQRPVVSGVSFGRAGERFNNYQQEQVGTLVTMTARVDEGGRIVTQLSFEMSRLDDPIGDTESAGEAPPPVKRTVTLQTTVSIPDGESVLLTDFDSQGGPRDTRFIGIVSATVEQGGAGAARGSSQNRLTLEARRYFGRLDIDDDDAISSEEWERSVRIRGMFETDGLDLSQPMSAEVFVENYLRLSNAAE